MKINILWEPDFVDEVQPHYFPYQFFLLVNKSSLLSCMNLLGSFNRLCKNNASFDYIIFLNACKCGMRAAGGRARRNRRLSEYIRFISSFPVC